ncbi:hypothetical protein PENTCL1PPCAC_30664, partial [Pristionchus entomophagus]
WLLLQLMIPLFSRALTETAGHLYCPLDSPNRYYGTVASWSINFDEYPVPLSSAALSQNIDACTELGSRADKLQAGVNKEGSFARAYCTPRCAFTIVMGNKLECAERRLPMQWSPGFLVPSRMTTKVDCSNISLPYAIDKYPENRVILQVTGVGMIPDELLFTINSLPVDIELINFPLSEKTITKVGRCTLYLKGFLILCQIAITNDQKTTINPTSILSSLANFPNIKEFSLNGVTNITTLPDFLKSKSKLIALRLQNNGLMTFPSWVMNLANLQYLKVQEYNIDPTFITKLNLPALEHFIMIGNNFSVLPSNFLSLLKT